MTDKKVQRNHMRSGIAAYYDDIVYQPVFLEYYGHSSFSNFGYWDEHVRDQKGACEALMEKLLHFLPEDKRGRVLDVACGKGGTTQYLLRYFRAKDVSAINISLKQLLTARFVAPGCGLFMMDAAHLGFKDESFDILFCVESAFHFITREQFLREAYRVLRRGGYLLLSDILMHKQAEMELPYRAVENYVRDLSEYEAICRRIGFVDIQVLDATKECWHGSYWNMIRLAHEKFLARKIDFNTLSGYLAKAYRMVGQLQYYVLAAARKRDDGIHGSDLQSM